MKGALPRSFTRPILFALAVEVGHKFDSRWLLNTQLFKLGSSEPYSEVIGFKQTVVVTEEIGAILQSIAAEDNFNTLVGDNIDRNTTTLDGRRTFHGMGVIAVITNKNSTCQEEPLRNRPKKLRDVCVYVYLKRSNFGGKEFREPAKFREFLLFFSNFSFKKKSSKQHSQKLLLVRIISPEVVYLFLDIKKNLKLLEEFFKCVDLTF